MTQTYIGQWFRPVTAGIDEVSAEIHKIVVYEAYIGDNLIGHQVSYGFTEWPSHCISIIENGP